MRQTGSVLPTAIASSSQLPNSTAHKEADRDPHVPSPIPPWVHPNDGTILPDNARLLSQPPEPARPNTRHHKPAHNYKAGRKWDHLRSAEPALLSMPIADHQARWRDFMVSGPNPQDRSAQARVVDQAWLDEHMPYLNRPWQPEDELEAGAKGAEPKGFSGLMYRGKWLISPERQERTVRVFWRLLLKNPFVPLVFRLIVLAFSAAGLGIAGTILTRVRLVNHDPNPANQCATRASTYMAICIGSVAIPYLGYVTWDEYMSKPLGLRSVPTKVLLLLCDLYFVVFAASNLSLAFDALFDHRWACYDEQFAIIGTNGPSYNVPATCPNNSNICYKQKTLSSVLFIGLLAWLITFSISVLRVVEKLRPD
ncbi:hypothetical protein BAUCODRAFT_70184 [Baudoinia panamericana UAMH 10762]|uniref:Uncharacterized protein n=1 Tax=Baudoinia panamericana (strain UAMH 10762) TaxID=717646 RepID=M2NCF7_BAUPA|nr:uncharacterized protein BAUCODRAFT_70184 [Baudoinia panamericana UAMH 10762]EMC96864.1 hypothetical protein BAUCODRAFT_70184 [Baudoinia panamericana UAMH 10762]